MTSNTIVFPPVSFYIFLHGWGCLTFGKWVHHYKQHVKGVGLQTAPPPLNVVYNGACTWLGCLKLRPQKCMHHYKVSL